MTAMTQQSDRRLATSLRNDRSLRIDPGDARRVLVKTALFRFALPQELVQEAAVGDFFILRSDHRTQVIPVSDLASTIMFRGIWPNDYYTLVRHETATALDKDLLRKVKGT